FVLKLSRAVVRPKELTLTSPRTSSTLSPAAAPTVRSTTSVLTVVIVVVLVKVVSNVLLGDCDNASATLRDDIHPVERSATFTPSVAKLTVAPLPAATAGGVIVSLSPSLLRVSVS